MQGNASTSRFITNGTKTVGQIIQTVAAKSKAMDFLVGYFFFSGYSLIAPSIGKKRLRILVGLDAQIDAEHCVREYEKISAGKNSDSKSEFRKNNWNCIVDGINNADIFDNKESVDTYKLFKQKVLDGTLEVRKTKEPNHSKMYVFHAEDDESVDGLESGKIIVGSSNFSYQGLKGRNEVNLYLQDSHDYDDGKEIFESLWKDSVPLVDANSKDEFLEFVKTRSWLEVAPSPYLLYVRVLYEYFKESSDYIKTPKEITRDRMNEFFDVSYQVDAIRDGVAKIKKHSGVIVADVVGLGKSVIASAIAANLDKRTIIISPPHLKTQWENYAADFGLRGCKVYTSGKIEDALNENKNHSNYLVIVDEAHRYRNENTEVYGFLHQLCVGNQVILLSATPFNNRPEDIFSLIKLFQIPAHSTIQTMNNLGNQMAELVANYKKLKKENRAKKTSESELNKQADELAQKIREILDPVVIRRTRVDLEKLEKYKSDLEAQGIQFADVQPPKSQNYELGELSDLYIDTLELLTDERKGFKGARYKPLTYLKTDKKLVKKYSQYFDDVENFASGQRNMAEFMKQLLVRRFESSKYSFIQSLKNINNSMNTLRRWFVELKKIPMAKHVQLPDIDELEAMLGDEQEGLFAGTDEIFNCAMSDGNKKGIWYIDSADVGDDFLKELDADIKLISGFLKKWEAEKDDPKLNAIQKNIKASLKKEARRKIIVFTEFSDTADYLYEKFEKAGIRTMMYSSKVASKTAREDIRLNFDAGCPENLQKDDCDVLVATDAISEGFSLHRAGTIYNYDIPYNPTRVIQRVGRINRINKKVFDKLFIYNFFPTATGEEVSHTAEISTFKMKLFQAILGADTKILTADETIDGYLGKKFVEAENEANSLSWDVEYRNELFHIEREEKETLSAAKKLPPRCRIARSGADKNGVLVFSKKGDAFRFCFCPQDGDAERLNPPIALGLFKACKKDKGQEVSDAFYDKYERAKQMSGVVKASRQNSKISQEALLVLNFLKTKAALESEKEYIEIARDAISWDSIPTYYTKQIARMNSNGTASVKELKAILPQEYLDSILQKERKVQSEPESILLAEELL